MIKNVRHYGIQTGDLKASMDFWLGMGFGDASVATEQWGDKTLRIARMYAPDNSVVELVQGDWPNHIAVTVEDVNAVEVEKTEAIIRPWGHKVVFCMSPEGTRIELVEEPK